MADNLASLSESELLDNELVRVTADQIELGFRRVAYLGYARRAGATKYLWVEFLTSVPTSLIWT